jgi:methylenetetrahydrofolate dehydrogenase (NADP+) / methenyltetrahydrofolate cyclohydrolase
MLIDGKAIAQTILDDLKPRVARLSFQPLLVDIVVGDDPVSTSYVAIKGKTAADIGLAFEGNQLAEDASTEQLLSVIKNLGQHHNLCGLLIQLPLPAHINEVLVLNAIPERIDVDGLGSAAENNFYHNEPPHITPPTAGAVLHILDSLNIELGQLSILVIGQGKLVGKPVTFLLKQRKLNVTTADGSTTNLHKLTTSADVIISGTGQAGLLTGDMIKPGAIIIDAGTAESGGGIVGDVDMESVELKAAWLSPVPGGVGPVTVAKLLENVVVAAERQNTTTFRIDRG